MLMSCAFPPMEAGIQRDIRKFSTSRATFVLSDIAQVRATAHRVRAALADGVISRCSSPMAIFDGAVVSADVGLLKPDPRIYQRLLTTFSLSAPETVFIDDLKANVDSAKAVGMEGLVFTAASSCEWDLRKLGMEF